MNGSPTARLLTQLWFLTIAVLAVAVLYLAKVLLLPLGIAILFAFLLAPVVAFLEHLRLPRPVAALLVIFAFASLLVVAAWTLFTQLVAIVDELPTYRDNITLKMEALHRPGNSAIGRAQREIQKISDELGIVNSTATAALQPPHKVQERPIGTTPEHPLQVREVGRPTGRLDQLGGIVEPLTTAALAVVFTFFVLLQREDLRNRLIRLSGERNLTLLTQAMRDASRRISRYFLLQVTVNLTFGTLIATSLYLIGLPHPVLFGALAAICRFVPYVGVPIAAITPILLSIAVFHGWEHTVLIAAVFIVLELLTGNYAEPHVYGRHTGLSSLAILIAAAFWTLIWGPVGLILSVPLTVCLVVMGSHVPSLEFLAVLLGDQPAIPPYTCFYQRLLAHDEREAAGLLDESLKTAPLVAIYDSILIPALTLVERDRQQGDLDDATLHFIRNATAEMVDELGFKAMEESSTSSATSANIASAASDAAASGSSPANSTSPAPQSLVPGPHVPSSGAPGSSAAISTSAPDSSFPRSLGPSVYGGDRQIAVIPIRDGADALVATMLTQVLSLAGFYATAIPIRSINETVASVNEENPAIIFLSGMPPVAVARANRLYRTLRSQQNTASDRNPERQPGQQIQTPREPKIVIGIWNYTDDPARAAQMISRTEPLHISTSLADALAQAESLNEPKPAVPEPLDPSPQLVTTPHDTAA